MSKVVLNNLIKSYDGKKNIINGIDLEIKDKEFIVLVGSSGCGKSTILRLISGLEEITSGDIYIDDKIVNDIHPKDRDIAFVFQSYALYPHMSVYDNIAFGLKMRNYDKATIDEKVKKAARALNLEELLDRKPKQLSGGQRQRVALGRAIVRNPKVFLMDEPLSNLDAKLRNQMRAELILLRKRINTTFIYVTHDQTEAMTLGDRIVIMKDGVAQQIGTPQELFYQPSNLFVATFIGSPQMNIINCKLLDDFTVLIGEKKVSLNEKSIETMKENNVKSQNIVLGIRPEHIELCEADSTNALSGTIKVVELMGSSMHVHVETSFAKNIVIVVPTTNLSSEELEKITTGNMVYFNWQTRLAHLFSEQTQANLMPIKK